MGLWRGATKAQVESFEVRHVIGTNLLALYPLCTFELFELHYVVMRYRISRDLFCSVKTGTALSKMSNVLLLEVLRVIHNGNHRVCLTKLKNSSFSSFFSLQ